MREFKSKEVIETISINGTELKMTDDPPPSIMADLLLSKDLDAKTITSEGFMSPFNVLNSYFYLNNTKQVVDKCMSKIGTKGRTEILGIVTNYIAEVMNPAKKKDIGTSSQSPTSSKEQSQ